jgi:uncharacterized protein (DUF2384 family)
VSAETAISDKELVSKSVVNAANSMGLDRETIANTLGVSIPTVARLKKGNHLPGQKPFELSLLLIRIYRSLYSIVGGNQDAMKHWMMTPNAHLGDEAPNKLIQNAEGMSRVLWYLDAMRGRI